MNAFGEPNMGNPSVRFDEGRERVGHWPVRLSIQPLPPTLLLWIGRDYSGSLHRLESTKVADKGCNVGGDTPRSWTRYIVTTLANIDDSYARPRYSAVTGRLQALHSD